MHPSHFLSIALLSTTISAFSLDSITDNKAVQGVGHLFRRQDSSSSDPNKPTSTEAAPSTKASSAASSASSDEKSSADSSTDSSAESTTGSSKASATHSSSGSAKSTDSSTGASSGATTKASGSATSTGKSSGKSAATTSYGNSVGYGGVTLISPNPIASSSYYKVGQYVTFAWNYTDLLVTPTAVDILASCSANQATYTIAMNQSISGPTGAVTWDTAETGSIPLLTETYTLMIHDAALDVSATAEYGHLAAYTQYRFAMYTPQPYTGLNEGWKCVTCSGAMSSMERQTLGFMFAMAAVAITSFTLFAGNFGVF